MSLNGMGELITAIGLVFLLLAEWRAAPTLRAFSKTGASIGFLVAAVGFGAFESWYGQVVFVGLALGAIGDVCLLGSGRFAFMAGLVSFLLGHVAYVVAFASLDLSTPHMFVTSVAMAVLMAFVARWVFPHAPDMRAPIALYMLVIAAMCVVAVGAGAAGAPWMIPVGAIMFTGSDLSVVRDRFIVSGFVNRVWGLPLYYAAQLIIAWSIAAVGLMHP
ncbi:MAG: lysoplasmalogenase [Myxococcota bacterium]